MKPPNTQSSKCSMMALELGMGESIDLGSVSETLHLEGEIHWDAYHDELFWEVLDRVYDIYFSLAADAWFPPDTLPRTNLSAQSLLSEPLFWFGFRADNLDLILANDDHPGPRCDFPDADRSTVSFEPFLAGSDTVAALRSLAFRQTASDLLQRLRYGSLVLGGRRDTQIGRHLAPGLLPRNLIESKKWRYDRRSSRLQSLEPNRHGELEAFAEVRLFNAGRLEREGPSLKPFHVDGPISASAYPTAPPPELDRCRSSGMDWPRLMEMRVLIRKRSGMSVASAAREVLARENIHNPSVNKRLENYYQDIPWGRFETRVLP